MYITDYMGYRVKPAKETPSHYIVVTAGKGGKIPAVLEGMFTSKTKAKQVIDSYLNSRGNKEAINAKEVSKD